MSRILLVLVFIVTFLGALIANLPARWAFEQGGLARTAISHDRISGSVWNGRMTNVSIAGQRLGDVSFAIKPLALLSGKLNYEYDVAGPPGRFVGDISVGFDRSIEVSLPRARVDVQGLERLQEVLRRAPSEVRIEGLRLAVTSDGACTTASGALTSDILQANGERLGWSGPEMVGTLSCQNGVVGLSLESAEGPDVISAELSFDGRVAIYDLSARVESTNPNVVQAVQQLGFQAEGTGFTYTRTNRPGPDSSSELSLREGN